MQSSNQREMPDGFFVAPETCNIVCAECTHTTGNCCENDEHILKRLKRHDALDAAVRVRNKIIIEDSTELKSAREQISLLKGDVEYWRRRFEQASPAKDRRYGVKPYQQARKPTYSNSAPSFLSKPSNARKRTGDVLRASPEPMKLTNDKAKPTNSFESPKAIESTKTTHLSTTPPILPQWMVGLLPDKFDPASLTSVDIGSMVTRPGANHEIQPQCILQRIWETGIQELQAGKPRSTAQQYLIDIAWEPQPFFVSFRQALEPGWAPEHSREDIVVSFVPDRIKLSGCWSLLKLATWIAHGACVSHLPRGIKFIDAFTLDLRNLAGFVAVHSRVPVENDKQRIVGYATVKLRFLFCVCSIFAASGKYICLAKNFEIDVAPRVRYTAFPYHHCQLLTEHDIIRHFARDGVDEEATGHYQAYALEFIYSLIRNRPTAIDADDLAAVVQDITNCNSCVGNHPGYAGTHHIRFPFNVVAEIQKRTPPPGNDVCFALDHQERIPAVEELIAPLASMGIADQDDPMGADTVPTPATPTGHGENSITTTTPTTAAT